VASVIGRVFSAPVLAEMAEHRPDLEDMLRQVEELEFIFRKRSPYLVSR
jgi:hypothetical protein